MRKNIPRPRLTRAWSADALLVLQDTELLQLRGQPDGFGWGASRPARALLTRPCHCSLPSGVPWNTARKPAFPHPNVTHIGVGGSQLNSKTPRRILQQLGQPGRCLIKGEGRSSKPRALRKGWSLLSSTQSRSNAFKSQERLLNHFVTDL